MDINPTSRSNAVAEVALSTQKRENNPPLGSKAIEAVEKVPEEVQKSHEGKVDVTV